MDYLCEIINKPEYYIYKFNIIQYSSSNKKIKNIVLFMNIVYIEISSSIFKETSIITFIE